MFRIYRHELRYHRRHSHYATMTEIQMQLGRPLQYLGLEEIRFSIAMSVVEPGNIKKATPPFYMIICLPMGAFTLKEVLLQRMCDCLYIEHFIECNT